MKKNSPMSPVLPHRVIREVIQKYAEKCNANHVIFVHNQSKIYADLKFGL